jgi:hypothetical protein
MAEALIGLQHHGAHGWTWTVHQPGIVSVWRTDQTGHGLQRQVPAGGIDAHGRPVYKWEIIESATNFALSCDRSKVLSQLRTLFADRSTSHAGRALAVRDGANPAVGPSP